MKITLEIPDGVRCLCISGVKNEGGELLLASTMVGSESMYDGAEVKALWGEEEKERSTQ